MTTTDVLDLLRRRWYISLVGLVVTLAVAYVVMSRPGVYTSRADVVLLPPVVEPTSDATLVTTSADVIATAGLVERTVNADVDTSAVTSQDVTLVGAGVRRGTLVQQPNAGGQWDYNFTSPTLIVQVAGPTRAEVISERTEAVAEILATLEAVQVRDEVAPTAMITARTIPQSPSVHYAIGYPKRAALGVGVLGCTLTVLAAVLVDRGSRKRRLTHEDSSPRPSAASV